MALGIGISCATTSVDEQQVRAQAAHDLACDESILRLENTGGKDGVAYYQVSGCGHVSSFECVESPQKIVTCRRPGNESPTSSGESSHIDFRGCNCGQLFASHSSDPAAGPDSPSVNSHTPQTQKRQ
jgi:hypothetical protein